MQVTLTLNPLAHVHPDTTVQAGHPHQPSLSHPKAISRQQLLLPLSNAQLELIKRYIPGGGNDNESVPLMV